MYYKASRMLNHHTHPTYPIRVKKTNVSDTSMANPFRQHNFTVRVSHRCMVDVEEFWRSRRIWALPLEGDEINSQMVMTSCAPMRLFGAGRTLGLGSGTLN